MIQGWPTECRPTLLEGGGLARSAAHDRMAAAIVRGDHSAAIIESRCTKHGGIERGFKPHRDYAPHAAHRVLPPSIAMTAAPEPKLVAKLLRAFVLSNHEGLGRVDHEVAVMVGDEALTEVADGVIDHVVFSQ